MDLTKIEEFALKNHNKPVGELQKLGMKSDKRFSKAKNALQDIVKRMKEQKKRDILSNANYSQIQDYIKQLESYGINIPGEPIKSSEPSKSNEANKFAS